MFGCYVKQKVMFRSGATYFSVSRASRMLSSVSLGGPGGTAGTSADSAALAAAAVEASALLVASEESARPLTSDPTSS